MSSRTVGFSVGLPGAGTKITPSDTGFIPARVDHVHPLWSNWEELDLNSPWTNTTSMPFAVCKISEAVMIRGIVENSGANQHIVTTLPEQFRPVNNRKVLRARRTTAAAMVQIEKNGDLFFTTGTGAALDSSVNPIYMFGIIFRIDSP